MSLIPRTAPMIGNPQAALRLGARWHRARSLLLLSSVVLPAVLGLVCVSFAGLTGLSTNGNMIGWSIIPALTAGACAAVLVAWLRRTGLTDPHSWVPATVLMTGSELVLGVVPGFGIAARSATGIAAKALLAIGVLGMGAACLTARLARHSLVGSPVAELGSTDFRLVLGDKPTRLVIETDRVEWTIRRDGSRFDAGVRYTQLHDVTAISVPESAVVLHTSSGCWTVPVADATLTRDLLQRRKALWDKRLEAAVERERELYRDLMGVLETATATASAPDDSIRVTVNANGGPTHIDLTERIHGHDPRLVADQIMACIKQGHEAVRQHVRHVTTGTFNKPERSHRELADDLLAGQVC